MAIRAAIVELTSTTKWSSFSRSILSSFSSPRVFSTDFSPFIDNSCSSTPFSTDSSVYRDLQADSGSLISSVDFEGKNAGIGVDFVANRSDLRIAADDSKISVDFAGGRTEVEQEVQIDTDSSKISTGVIRKETEIDADCVGEEQDVPVKVDCSVDFDSLDADQENRSMEDYDEENPSSEKEIPIDVEKLEELLSLLQSSIDDSLISNLDNLNLDLHEELVIKVLETPCVRAEILLLFFNWSLKQFSPTPRSVESLVKSVLQNNKQKKIAYHLWDIVNKITETHRNSITVTALNILISSFASLGKPKAALQVFDKFSVLDCLPNSETYFSIIEAVFARSFFDQASQICKKMVEIQLLPGSTETGKIISSFCKSGFPDDAILIYNSSKEKNMILPQRCINFLIKSLSLRYEQPQSALQIAEDLTQEHKSRQYTWIIRGFCRINHLDSAKSLLMRMINKGPIPGNTVFNNVINSLSKNGDVGEAEQIMNLMEKRKLKPDVYTYTVIMSGYVGGGEMDEACRILSMAKKNHKVLSPATYHTIISGFCKLEQFDRAVEFMAEMEEFGVKPNVDQYSKLIQSLCLKSMDWKKAEKLLEEMKGRGLKPNVNSVALVGAVRELVEEVDGENVTALCSEG